MSKMFSLKVLVLAVMTVTSVGAATVTVNIDGTPTQYTLSGVSVDAQGNVVVTAAAVDGGGGGVDPVPVTYTITLSPGAGGTIIGASSGGVYNSGTPLTLTASPDTANGYTFASWGGACAGTTATTCSVTMNSNTSVSATFTQGEEPPPSTDGCGETPKDTTIIQSGVPTTLFKRVTVSPSPGAIRAYEFSSGASGRNGYVNATKYALAQTGKLVVISECPGSQVPVQEKGCAIASSEVSYMDYTVSSPLKTSRYYCGILPNKTYFANVFSVNALGATSQNCSTTSNCSYYFEMK